MLILPIDPPRAVRFYSAAQASARAAITATPTASGSWM
jgi:hypothetical protein